MSAHTSQQTPIIKTNSVTQTADEHCDRARLQTVATTHYAFVGRVLRRLGLSDAAADDATQQVFLVLARRLGEVELGAEKSFLYRTATLVVRAARRSYIQRREQAIAVDSEGCETVEDRQPGPEELAQQKEARALLDQAMSTLDREEREVFVLFELEGISMADIASSLGIPVGTCASRLRRAREQLHHAVKRMMTISSSRGENPSSRTTRSSSPPPRRTPSSRSSSPRRHRSVRVLPSAAAVTDAESARRRRRLFWMLALGRVTAVGQPAMASAMAMAMSASK